KRGAHELRRLRARGACVTLPPSSRPWRGGGGLVQSTMQDFPLTIGAIFRHGRAVFGDSEVVTFEGDGSRRASFAEVAGRVDRLAAALRRLGIESGDRVATFAWNNQ